MSLGSPPGWSRLWDFRRNKVFPTKVRTAQFSNGRVKAVGGECGPLAKARFTADANPVLNVDARPVGEGFFLATGGGTENKTTRLDEVTSREEGNAKPPADLPESGGS